MNDMLEVELFEEEIEEENDRGRFHDGNSWVSVIADEQVSVGGASRSMNPSSRVRRSASKDETPVPPMLDGDGKILVTIPSFRGMNGMLI